MAAFTRNGYGQVEPNQLSAQKTGQIYASLPLAADVSVLQNGEFMYYDYKTKTVTADATVGEPMLVFNEIKLYEPFYRETYKNFAMVRVGDNYVTTDIMATEGFGDGAENIGAPDKNHTEYGYRMDGIAPRLFKTNIGDIYTTNMVATGVEYVAGDKLAPVVVEHTYTAKDGSTKSYKTMQLTKTDDANMLWVVAKVYTMPDGQPGLKIQRIK
jgi:hypothetical protein